MDAAQRQQLANMKAPGTVAWGAAPVVMQTQLLICTQNIDDTHAVKFWKH